MFLKTISAILKLFAKFNANRARNGRNKSVLHVIFHFASISDQGGSNLLKSSKSMFPFCACNTWVEEGFS
jgi:hypothetical protein